MECVCSNGLAIQIAYIRVYLLPEKMILAGLINSGLG